MLNRNLDELGSWGASKKSVCQIVVPLPGTSLAFYAPRILTLTPWPGDVPVWVHYTCLGSQMYLSNERRNGGVLGSQTAMEQEHSGYLGFEDQRPSSVSAPW